MMHPEIARRAILAGTSGKGVCPECGAPWRRVVEGRSVNAFDLANRDALRGRTAKDGFDKRRQRSIDPDYNEAEYGGDGKRTTGWTPTCKCGRTDTVPATILDPFDDGTYRGDEQVKDYRIIQGDVRDVLATLPDESVHCVVTSPPYWGLRDYGTADWQGGDSACDHSQPRGTTRGGPHSTLTGGQDTAAHGTQYALECGKCGARRVDRQLGLEPTPQEFVQHMVEIFREVRRVLRRDGTLWLNMGDSYNGSGGQGTQANVGARRVTAAGSGASPRHLDSLKPKDLVGMPWRVAFALQEDGWYLRSAITWCKKSPMPESVTDRPTSATEMIFLLARSEKYYYDADAVREPHSRDYTDDRYPVGGRKHRVDADNPMARGGTGQYDRDYDNPKYQWNPERGGRNLWNYWLLGPEPYAQAHFATFPTAIPRRAILAGTSERGVCPQCGAPWKRVVERDVVAAKPLTRKDAATDYPGSPMYRNGTHNSGLAANEQIRRVTGGWTPTCKCGRTDTVPALVLDPFFGAGTTGLVALRLNRRAIGIELNPEYIAMSHKRILGDPQAMNLNMELVEMEESA